MTDTSESTKNSTDPGPKRWQIILGAFVMGGVFLALIWQVPNLRGDETFGGKFSLIDRSEIISGGPPKDGIPALTDPEVVPASEAAYLRPGDRVIGVEIDGEARAYPLRILIWHEAANDTLGGEPILVTYCPLCDSALVFDRNVGGEVREFGISGKLWKSNVLLYDRQPREADESLWSQLYKKAVVGPAAKEGLELEVLPSELTTWRDWRNRHPETTVLSTKTGHRRDYDNTPYAQYFATDQLMFGGFERSSRRPDLKNKDRVVAVSAGGEQRLYVVKDVAAAAGDGGVITDTLGDVPLRITHLPEAESLRVEPAADSDENAPELDVAYTFWFAWEEINPGTGIWSPDDRS